MNRVCSIFTHLRFYDRNELLLLFGIILPFSLISVNVSFFNAALCLSRETSLTMRPNKPKKRPKDTPREGETQTDATQADRELFLQAFESKRLPQND